MLRRWFLAGQMHLRAYQIGRQPLSTRPGLPVARTQLDSRTAKRRDALMSQPLRELHRHPFRSGQEHQLAIMKLHDVVAQLDATRTQSSNLGLNVVDRKADMIEAQLVEPGDVTIPNRLGVTVPQELNLNTRCGVGKRQGHVLSLDVRNAHVSGELPT